VLGAGTRTAGLVKYLPRFGWDVSMITAAEPRTYNAGPHVVEVASADYLSFLRRRVGARPGESVAQRLGADAPVTGTRSAILTAIKTLKSVLAYPDERRSWIRPAVSAAKTLARKSGERPTTLLSTSPAVSAHVVAARLAQHWGVPWTADLRDLWSDNPYNSYLSARHVLDERLERRTLARAQRLITVSEELADSLRSRHAQPVSVITNGFDPESLRPDAYETNRPFTIVHTGGLYSGKRDPGGLLRAIKELVEHGEVGLDDIRLDFYGPREGWLDRRIAELGLQDLVHQNGPVTAKQALEIQRRSHVLLLLTWDDPADRGTCPVKLFEYMAARRPVLSLGYTRSTGSRIVEECELGRSFGSNDIAAVRWFLREQMKTAEREDLSVTLEPECGSRYTQPEMARKVADILNEISAANIRAQHPG